MLKHKCLKELNTKLAKRNAQLLTDLEQRDAVFVSAIKTDSTRAGVIRPVRADFCPFCGTKLKR